MRNLLTETLLVKIMEWTPDEIDRERPLLQAMADLKWNEYQQFAPGTRFIESLVKWLQQFETIEDRKIAYKLVREHLIFISSEQVSHLVDILYPEKVNPFLIKKTAAEIGLAPHLVTKIINSPQYAENQQMSMYMGLSDGSRIDQFRRVAFLNNEQVLPTYEPSAEKIKEMVGKLQEALPGKKFRTLFFIDDFTASGKTYYRSGGKGKLGKVLKTIFDESAEGYKDAIDFDNIEIHILFYIATTDAIKNIKDGIALWKKESGKNCELTVDCLLEIDSNIKERITADEEIVAFLKKYFDDRVVDEHYEKGKHDEPYLGFNECALPIVLNHNAPNNTIAIFWLPADMKPKGLFPRISRHREK